MYDMKLAAHLDRVVRVSGCISEGVGCEVDRDVLLASVIVLIAMLALGVDVRGNARQFQFVMTH